MTSDVREALLAERRRAERRMAELRRELAGFVEASRDTNADDEHDPEGATIAFERAQVGSLLREVARRLGELDAALERERAGEYGVCAVCRRPIPAERLAIRPSAHTCVPCASRRAR